MERRLGGLALVWMMFLLAGCGGGSPSHAPSNTTYTLGGNASGLTSGESVTLLNNGGDALTLSANGSFSFSTGLTSGNTYDVTVQSQTPGLSCSAGNGSGTIGSSNVTSVVVSCALIPFSVSGTVSGLSTNESVTLQNNAGDTLIVSGNGAFTFATSQTTGATYDVTVQSHTPGITCPVNNGSGTIASSNVTSIVVSCAAGTESVLHSFGSSTTDGVLPDAGLVMDGAGNLYGTTEGGGASVQGTVFEIDAAGTESVLYSFAGNTDGSSPQADLLRDSAGNLYGTTFSGGASSAYGTVFKISAAGTESIVHSFTAPVTGDGESPLAGLVMDNAGNLYGTTYVGGAHNDGAVFKIDAAGTESVLYSFPIGTNGNANPSGSLIMDSSGNLYGTTVFGGANNGGTVFRISATGSESIVYSFGSSASDGWYPESRLIMDSDGNLYGTTTDGGASNGGTVFKIGTDGTEGVLHSFGSSAADGLNPRAGLVLGSDGNLYGTTYAGGANGDGTVFKISVGGTESVLYSFGSSASDGMNPVGGLAIDSVGNLYGTTSRGGVNNDGTVFKIN